ncbi:SseB family protein [Amaricoccus solimangrovi]|uniref:SseB family protein n=1 Tax=Amaricoccus solimangrovi TaxID=2589815 RepID=A0A501WW96_9RHOB|nr:SseB family protein [Amaricoccus solimangrovi]TPE53718.1 SseB family protein [Amaricoccus solimangrovi]
MSETAIDEAFRAMEADPGDEAARARFHERVLDAELHLLLAEEPETDDALRPQIFEIPEGRFVLAFDRDERLAAFLSEPMPYAILPGRRLVAMIAGHGLGLGLNLGEAPSATLLPAAAVDWLAEAADVAPERLEGAARRFGPPAAATPALIAALDRKLAAMAGVMAAAHLVEAEYADGARGLLLLLAGVPEAAREGVAAGIAETARLGGGATLDVAFPEAGAPVLAAARRGGLTFDLPAPSAPETAATPPAPGMDPAKPPILRR